MSAEPDTRHPTGPVTASVPADRTAPARVGFWQAVRADHSMVVRGDEKYSGHASGEGGSLLGDSVKRIGFQMMIAYRVMRLLRSMRLTPLAMLLSRAIRHLYAADIHWEAEIAPGVAIVHGTALVVSRDARVGSGCILFQSVTLGVSIDPVTRKVGGPTLEQDVHVGPGASVLGPITIGRGSKIMANAVVMASVPPFSLVEVAAPVVRPRVQGLGGPA